MEQIELAKIDVYQAWNHTDHADKLMQNARHALENGNIERAIEEMRSAKDAAQSAAFQIGLAIEAAQKAR